MKPWLSAFRLRTLPLAISSILVGSALAYHHGALRWPVFALALLTAVLLQVLSNLANDLGDHQHGTDNAQRIGPQRAVQSGAISPYAMKRAMIICGVLAFISGCALITIAFGLTITTLAFLLVGLLAIAAAVKYTFGKNPYGYAGLGDVSVLVFFGPVGVVGTYYLHAHAIGPEVLAPAVSFGLLSVGVLNVNNMRDIVNDAASGKRTIPVRIGSANARRYHAALLLLAGFLLLAFTVNHQRSSFQWLWVAPYTLVALHLRRVALTPVPAALDPELKRLALATFLTSIVFSLGLIIT
jgi:1,4-dihydroxy-2-naphthoate octaprenyltransferase